MTFVFLNSDLYSTQYYIEGPDNLLTILTIIMLNTNVSFLMNFRSPASPSFIKFCVLCSTDFVQNLFSKKILQEHYQTVKQFEMKKVNKQCLLDTPRTVRVREKTCQIIFSEPNSFMHMFNVLTLYQQSIKLLHQKLW